MSVMASGVPGFWRLWMSRRVFMSTSDGVRGVAGVVSWGGCGGCLAGFMVSVVVGGRGRQADGFLGFLVDVLLALL